MEAIKRLLRTGQTYFPFILDQKFALKRWMQKTLSRPFEADFRVVSAVRLAPSEVFLDIGGNRGQSVEAIRLYHPAARIISFEPNTFLYDRLVAMFAADPNTEVQPYALGAVPGRFDLFVPFYNGWMFDGLASLNEAHARSDFNPVRLALYDPAKLNIEKVSCEVRRLDDLDLSPGFIKIDVEGGEIEVLRGAEALLARHRPIIMSENTRGPEVSDFLAARGFSRAAFRNGALHFDTTGDQNTFYVPEERIATLDRGKIPVLGR